jgi:hypothetical protein
MIELTVVTESYNLRYVITPSALQDAAQLYSSALVGRIRGVLALMAVVGVLIALAGDLQIGLSVGIFGMLMLGLTWIRFMDRWLYANRGRGVMGETCEYVVDDRGIHYQHPLGSGDLPWSALTDVQSNEKSILFKRDRVLAAYVPTIAFSSQAEREAFLEFARAHVDKESAD